MAFTTVHGMMVSELRAGTIYFIVNFPTCVIYSLIHFPIVDSLLDPENRLHLTTDEQLKALLDKLDMVTSMRTSGGRTKRIRLLRREINTLRQKMNQQQQNSLSVNGNDKEGKEEEEEEEQEEKEKKTDKMGVVDNGHLTVSNSGAGKKKTNKCCTIYSFYYSFTCKHYL